MQIFFISGKARKQKNTTSEERKKLIDKKNEMGMGNKELIFIIILCEVIGTLFITYISRKHIFDIEIYKAYYINKIGSKTVNRDKYCVYLFLQYLKEIFLFEILNFTKYKRAVNYLYIVYKTITLSISFGIMVLLYGMEGQLKFILTLFPQGIVFYGFILWLMKISTRSDITYNKNNVGKIILLLFLAVLVSCVTAIMETYINLGILYKILCA